ncbi:MAG: sulfotransferase [Gammaproteobacteria bacterium]|nr:sulfotransferase [Gammaproteobacteria bacterium]
MTSGHHTLEQHARVGATARKAARAGNWSLVKRCADEILKQDRRSPEGWFLTGLLEKSSGRHPQAVAAFTKALHYDADRYDAALELANLCLLFLRHKEAVTLLNKYEPKLENSPYYQDMAATLYTRLGLHEKAWPLLKRANELQPDIDRLEAGLAACAVNLGKIKTAKTLYNRLLHRHPHHQRNHYALAQLERAQDDEHVKQMQSVLESTQLPPEKNIFLYYALGKELEDLERWDEAFDYYRMGGEAAAAESRAAGYSVDQDIELIDHITRVCNEHWLAPGEASLRPENPDRVPIFIVGLPRTGTTLTERIVSSHTRVESADETFFLRIAIKKVSGVESRDAMNTRIVEYAANRNPDHIASTYLNAISYRLTDKPWFIDKYPENYLYLGFIARAFPQAKIIHLRRNPMDACFAMFKQSYFRQAYTLDDLGRFYVAYDRLSKHWKDILGDRLVEVAYESLVSDLEGETRRLLDRLGLEFQQSCVDFHLNRAPSATASKVQIRERAHTRSVDKWKNWERQLQPLREHLEASGIAVD